MSGLDGFLLFELESEMLYKHDDGNFVTLLFGFTPGHDLDLASGYTHLGVVVQGKIKLLYHDRERELVVGDYFSIIGPATLKSEGCGIISSALNYVGANVFGGPIENVGRLRYMDGCTDSLLVPPIRRGDPCLNHLHFPSGIRQTPHTHPSVRTGIVYRGVGECIVPGCAPIALRPLHAFVIPTNSIHSFNTTHDIMDVIAYHPDSDAGMTDDDHPMINRTYVDGVSARFLHGIRTTGA